MRRRRGKRRKVPNSPQAPSYLANITQWEFTCLHDSLASSSAVFWVPNSQSHWENERLGWVRRREGCEAETGETLNMLQKENSGLFLLPQVRRKDIPSKRKAYASRKWQQVQEKGWQRCPHPRDWVTCAARQPVSCRELLYTPLFPPALRGPAVSPFPADITDSHAGLTRGAS